MSYTGASAAFVSEVLTACRRTELFVQSLRRFGFACPGLLSAFQLRPPQKCPQCRISNHFSIQNPELSNVPFVNFKRDACKATDIAFGSHVVISTAMALFIGIADYGLAAPVENTLNATS
eukprot:3924426-Amphidinium_carterae.1